MNSKIKSIKNKLKKYLNNKDIYDIILFGSTIKGKSMPNDVDIGIVSDKDIKINIPGFHISLLKPKNFFINPPTIINTLFREGYSIKNNKFFSENFRFSNKVLFKYELSNLKPSIKVKIVNVLRGKNKEKGMVEQNNGKWLANQVFIVPVTDENIFEKFLINHKVSYNKFFVLIH